ncbi:MAG: rhodanese-like domain-containing protein [Cyclobacteriaceae bacterium]
MNTMINFFKKKTKGYENISTDVFQQKLVDDPNAVLIDVRTEAEYKEGYIPGTLLIDYKASGFRDKIEELDKSKNYYLYCRSGARSASACRIMAENGFKELYNLSGGILGWDGAVEK